MALEQDVREAYWYFFLTKYVCCRNIYNYLFNTQSTHIDKSYIYSNATIHRINDKYIIILRYITVNRA